MKTVHVCFNCGALYVYDDEKDNKYYDLCKKCEKEGDYQKIKKAIEK